jgi:hypothetical protein
MCPSFRSQPHALKPVLYFEDGVGVDPGMPFGFAGILTYVIATSQGSVSEQNPYSNSLILLVGAGRFERPTPCARGTRVHSNGSAVFR